MPAQAKNAPTPITPSDLLTLAVPRSIQPMIAVNGSNFIDNGTKQFQLNRNGLGIRMFINLQLLFTVAGTVTSGTFTAHAPEAGIANIIFGANTTAQLRNHSLWDAYKHNRYRSGIDPLSHGRGDKYSGQAMASLGISQSGGAQQVYTTVTTGANSATQTLGSTAGILPNQWVYFATEAVWRQVLSITSATVLVLYSAVNSTTGEAVTLANGNGSGGLLIPQPGANIVAGTYAINVALELPMAYNNIGQESLLELQNDSIYTLAIQGGNIASSLGATGGSSDIVSSLVGTGLSYTVSGTYYCSYETMPYIDTSAYDYSEQTNSVLSVLSASFPITKGKNSIQVPRADLITMYLVELVDGNGVPIPDASITEFSITYGGNQIMLDQDRYTKLIQSYYDHDGNIPMDGVWDVDLGIRTGQLALRDLYDAFNDRNIVDLTFNITIGGSQNMTGATAYFTMEALQDSN